jgi:hypothetical protein
MKLHYSYFMLMGVLKNFGFCTAAGIAAAVPSSIAIQYWGGTTYRGFLNFDILVLSLIFAGFRYVQGKIRFLGMGLCLLAAAASIFWDWQLLTEESFDFNIWINSLRSHEWGAFIFAAIFSLQLTCCGLLVSRAKPTPIDGTILFVFAILVLHNLTYAVNSNWPIAEFPALQKLEYFVQTQSRDKRSSLSPEMAAAFPDTAGRAVSLSHLDASRSNVVILVESWGVPRNVQKMRDEFAVFNKIASRLTGLQKRDSSNTAHAEQLDFGNALKALRVHGFEATALFGDPDSLYGRTDYISALGFQNTVFGNGIEDEALVIQMDSLLNSRTGNKKLIVWTTTATRFPMKDSAAYFKALKKTQQHIVRLAEKYPMVRFIVTGDHEPLRCPRKFRNAFYRRWVPYIILN